MARPKIRELKAVKTIKDLPVGTYGDAFNLVEKNSSWRSVKPIINKDLCVQCEECYLTCPDGVIYFENFEMKIDYDFCKGCGICEKSCGMKAITMEREE